MTDHTLWRDAATEMVLRWDVARRAIGEEWGGPETAAMMRWLGSVVADYFLEFPDDPPTPTEVEGYLAEVFLNELSAVLEEGVAVDVGLRLVQLFREYTSGKHAALLDLQANPTALPVAAPGGGGAGDADSEDGGDVDEAMDAAEDADLAATVEGMAMGGSTPAPEDDGWTVVSSSKKGPQRR